MPKGDKEHLKADPEDGTTPIANLLLEAIAILYLSGKAKGILLLLCRKTYGWHKDGIRHKESALSLDDCAKALGIDKRTAQKLLSDLTNNKVLLRSFSKPGYGYTYAINTRISDWNNSCINHQLLRNLTTDGLNKNSTLQLGKKPIPIATNSRLLNKDKEIINKDINGIDLENTLYLGQSLAKILRILRKETKEHEGIPEQRLRIYRKELKRLGIEV